MSGIAELLANLGYEVSGSDLRSDPTSPSARDARRARARRATPPRNIGRRRRGRGVVGDRGRTTRRSSRRARDGVPVIPRAEMLAELMRLRYGIAIAGAHGKTTTTSMVALVLERAGLDPTAVIGGRLSAFGSNARLGQGDVMVAEADESDGSFLKLSPAIAVITNVDREHLEHYGTLGGLAARVRRRLPTRCRSTAPSIVCADDGRCARCIPRITRRVMTYGFADDDRRPQLVARPVAGHGDVTCSSRSGRAARSRRRRRADARSSATFGCTCPAATTC